jgi:hypothetical protein
MDTSLTAGEAVSRMGHTPQCGRSRQPHGAHALLRERPSVTQGTPSSEGEAVSPTDHTLNGGRGRQSQEVHPLLREWPARVVFKDFCMISDAFHRNIVFIFRDMAGCGRLYRDYDLFRWALQSSQR